MSIKRNNINEYYDFILPSSKLPTNIRCSHNKIIRFYDPLLQGTRIISKRESIKLTINNLSEN
jgi:hypothetical protein